MTSLDQSQEHSPVVVAHQAQRATEFQLRIADKITAFAGSMNLRLHPRHRLRGVDAVPRVQTMADAHSGVGLQQAKADHDFHAAEQELDTNTDLTRAIHHRTAEIHHHIVSGSESAN
jgi:hypothetical protein